MGWWFTGEAEEKAYMTAGTHSPGCRMLGTDGSESVLWEDLDVINQDFVLGCPHRSHDSVKWLMRTESPNKDKGKPIEDGHLF